MKVKVADSKLLILFAIFISVVVYMTITSIGLIDNTTASFIGDMQSEDIVFQLLDDINLLKETTNAIAEDKDIIEALQFIDENGYTDEYAQILRDNIQNFSHIMANLSFVDTITIISPSSNIIVSESGVLENYDVYSRDWFDTHMLFNSQATLTDVYDDIMTGKKASSIIRVVSDPSSGEALGFVLLDIFLDDLILNIKDNYRIADIEALISYPSGSIYSYQDELIFSDNQDIDYKAIYTDKNISFIEYFDADTHLVLAVDLDSIKQNEFVADNSSYVISRIVGLTLAITIIIIIVLLVLLKPIFSAITSLVHIIEELGEDYPEYNMGISKVGEMAKFVENSLPKKIKYLIYYDELTGLPNRKMFKILYKKFAVTQEPFAIILLDVKNFKGINDNCGDEIGDLVLIEIGRQLTGAVGGTDGVAIRYSGDEFIIIIEHDQIDNNVGEFYETKILPRFSQPLQYNDSKPIQVEFNAVAVVNPIHCGTEEDMITKIYVMLRECKELNTQRLFVFSNDVYSIYVNEERIKESLKLAIEQEEFVINYQPIVDGAKVVRKAEALVRWFSKDLGFVPPNKFIYVAEQTRMIIDLGYWIIERVAKDLQTLFKVNKPLQISINISPIQLMNLFLCVYCRTSHSYCVSVFPL
ncbi:MAG: hypothetical protein ATN34_00665 [Epulopiscium sp. Nele67-Bin002]|nr:MAG: hypothetical protein ATN34_00665 [Epulopiscium sp. Nele67-Bin002]